MASAVETAETAIWSRVQAQLPSVVTKWPNVPFETPSPRKVWIAPTILWGQGFGSTIGLAGQGRNTVVGVIQFDIFGPIGGARASMMAVADQIRDAFNRVEFSGVRCNTPSAPINGPADDEWARFVVSVDFSVDETL